MLGARDFSPETVMFAIACLSMGFVCGLITFLHLYNRTVGRSNAEEQSRQLSYSKIWSRLKMQIAANCDAMKFTEEQFREKAFKDVLNRMIELEDQLLEELDGNKRVSK